MINEIKSKEGYVFALKDKSEVYDNIIVLGKYDSEDNYIQVTIEEAKILKLEIERKLNEDLTGLEINEN
jgi:hypothetical protein